MISLEPLGTDVLLPAILVGYELPDTVPDAQLDAVLPANGAVVHVCQQAGGHGMSYPTAFGALLRLAANNGRDGRPLDVLVRGLKAMAEDPDMQTLRQYPALLPLVATHGHPYTRDELASLGDYLGRFIDVPPLVSGIEAWVRFAPCDVLAVFRGWHVLTCRVPVPDGLGPPIYTNLPGHRVDSSNVQLLRRDDIHHFRASVLREITEAARRLGLSGRPTAFLVWENSD